MLHGSCGAARVVHEGMDRLSRGLQASVDAAGYATASKSECRVRVGCHSGAMTAMSGVQVMYKVRT